MAPDIDVVAKAAGPLAEWTWHRSVTHSLLLLPLVGLVAGYALGRWKGGALSSWIGLAVVALVSHPLLDFCTSYGTQLLAPFSDRRFALDAAGRPLGPGERFDRQLPAPASRLLLTLWRETLGLS